MVLNEDETGGTDHLDQNNWEALVSCPVCNSESITDAFSANDYHHGSATDVQVCRCHDCTAGFTNPRPPEEDILSYYPTDYEQHTEENETDAQDSRLSQAVRSGFHTFEDVITPPSRIALSDKGDAGRVLDVGCGRGRFLAGIAERGWDVEGIDLDQRAVDVSNEKPNVIATRTRLQDFEPNHDYELLTMWHSLEHMHHPQDILSGAHNLLTEEGRLLIEVPNFDSFLASYFRGYWYDLDVPRHLVHFTPRSIRSLCQDTGFYVETIHWRPSARSLVGTLQFRESPVIPPRPAAIAISNLYSRLKKSSRILIVARPR